jgi:hypothetical protein
MAYSEKHREIANEGMRSPAGDKKHISKYLSLSHEDRKKTDTLSGRMYRGLHKSQDKSTPRSKALKGGHKQGEREAGSKKAGFYVAGHKNYGDVYEK